MKTHWFPLIRPAIRAGYFLGVPLGSHELQEKTAVKLRWRSNKKLQENSPKKNRRVDDESGQFIATFSAGWSPQMVVNSKGSVPPQNGLKVG